MPVQLAVSLNAVEDELRGRIMPINRKYPVKKLMEACQEYARVGDNVVTFEYVLFGEVNDSLGDASKLVKLLSHTPCKVNLIPFNEYPGSLFKRPDNERVVAFQHQLADKGLQVNIRYSKGLDVQAACGQLATGT